jgi:hypothetical protein
MTACTGDCIAPARGLCVAEMKVELPKTAVEAIVGLAYRGTVNLRALRRIGPTLDGHRSSSTKFVALEIEPEQLDTLRAISAGKRPPGLGALGKRCHDALEQLPKQSVVRRGPQDAPAAKRGPPRKCVTCGRKLSADHFVGERGTRCRECRSARAADVRFREILGGAPETSR